MTSTKQRRKTQTKIKGVRWQTKRFFLRPEYVEEMRNILSDHKQLSPNARKIGLAVCDHWGHKRRPKVHPGFEALAQECGVGRQTIRRRLAELERWGLIRTHTPRWDKRIGGRAGATELYFPVGMVKQSLKIKGIKLTRQKVNKTGPYDAVSVSGVIRKLVNKTGLYDEVSVSKSGNDDTSVRKDEGAAPARSAAGLTSASLAASAQERKASAGDTEAQAMAGRAEAMASEEHGGKLGAYYERDGRWYDAVLEPSPLGPKTFPLGTRVTFREWHGDCEPVGGEVVGFPIAFQVALGQVLVRWDDNLEMNEPWWISYEELRPLASAGNVSAGTPATASPPIQPTTQEPVKKPPAYQYCVGDRVRHDRLGHGTVVGLRDGLVQVDFDVRGVHGVVPAWLELVAGAAAAGAPSDAPSGVPSGTREISTVLPFPSARRVAAVVG